MKPLIRFTILSLFVFLISSSFHANPGVIPDKKTGSETMLLVECDYTIELWDSYGDGWNGCYLNVFVDGIPVLSQITIEDGLGPEVFTIPVSSGSLIEMDFELYLWPEECYYYVYDAQGNLVFEDGEGGEIPTGGEINADCGGCIHMVELNDDFGDGWNGASLDVMIDGILVLEQITLLDGYGPETYSFLVEDGALVNFIYSQGEWAYENSYIVYNNAGEIVFEDGAGGQQPVGGEIQTYCSNTNVSDLFLRVGPYLLSDPWVDWVSANQETHVQLMASDPDNEIMMVNFYVSPDGNEWGFWMSDDDGSEPIENTYGSIAEGGGWDVYLPPAVVPMGSDGLYCRAEIVLWSSDILVVENRVDYDFSPPSEIEVDVIDWMIIEDDSISINIDPGSCIDLSYVELELVLKADTFAKGIPPISQQPHSTVHCAPSAAAACLKYFEGQGDNQICGGLNNFDLVQALAGVCNTSSTYGTKVSNLTNGLRKWLGNHGNGYTLRGPLPFNWQQMRNELEKCQDVLSGIYWPNNGGGHRMVFNSIINRPDPVTGLIRVDFMDPWTGQIEYGNLDPSTGVLTGFTSAGASGELGNIIIICPRESSMTPGTGVILDGPDPPLHHLPIPLPSPFDEALFFLRIHAVDNTGHKAAIDLVIDYQPVENRDWGDAPDDSTGFSYPTFAIHDGANHNIVTGVHLGGSVDSESDGQPSPAAVRDDNIPFPSDEDGIQFLTSLVPGQIAKIRVFASVDGYLNAWIDFDRNMDWAGEKIFMDKPLVAAPTPNILSFMVPASASVGTTFARFRYTTYNTYDSLSYTGPADDGEVIDHLIEIVNEEDKSKMHRPQLPDLTTNGVDVYCMEGESGKIVLADDFMCMETGLITDIHIWGSWKDDFVPLDDMPIFQLGIWSDNPNGPYGYSQPEELLCEFSFEQDQYTMELYAEVPDKEWFYWPHLNNAQFPGDSMVYKLNFYIPESEICMQDSGTIYWLSVNVVANAGASYEFGWKSSRYHFNDNAVWQIDPPMWNMLQYPPTHPLNEEYMDMAFYISGHPPITPEIRIKDCPIDVGSVPSNTVNCPNFWASWDIWIDNDNDGFRDAPVVGAVNNLYGKVRNDGPGIANNVSIDFYYRNNTTGLTFPAGAPYIGSLSGLSVLPGDSTSGFVSWTVPPPPDSLGHYCIGAVVSAPYDPQTSIFVPWDNNLSCVNIGYLYWRAGLAAKDDVEPVASSFNVRNPFNDPQLFNVEISWVWPPEHMPEFKDANGFPIDMPYTVLLDPLEEQLITMTIAPSAEAQHGDEALVELTQYLVLQNKQNENAIGGMTYPMLVDLYPPEAISDLEVTEVNGDMMLSWTPATSDVAGNPDHIACYNIYKWPDTLDRIGRAAVSADYPLPKFNWFDPEAPEPGENPIYIVKVEDEAGYESGNSNLGYEGMGNIDFGDAPEGLGLYNYPTLAASGGANHTIDPMVFLGARVDGELDGKPGWAAVGDDNNPTPTDEKGVRFITSLVPGKTATIKVIASVDGFLNAWVDFNGNSDWTGEQIFTDEPLIAGPNFRTFNVPASAITGTTFTRFRFTTYNTAGTLTYKYDANDGEVEDHMIEIIMEEDESKMHFPQWPDLTTHGVDVFCMQRLDGNVIVADDFRCMETGLITDIHIWGSWKDDVVPWGNMPSFVLGIWSDNPNGPNGYSQPAELLCEYTFEQDQYDMEEYARVPDGEWFYWPQWNIADPLGDTMVYKFDFYIPEDVACNQDSLNIYWLSVNIVGEEGANYEFGWKSSKYHFNDYAVWTPDPPGWNVLQYPPSPHPLTEEYMDMAFYISGHPVPDVWIKDCDADNGLIVPSTVPCGGYVCAGPDIWIDNDSDGFMDAPVEDAINRLYIRARNLGPGTANNVTASLYYRNSSTGLNFPTGATYIDNIGPLTIPAGGSVYDYVDWYVPAAPTYGHYCIGGIVTAPYDPQTFESSPDDNNLAFVNIWALYSRVGDSVPAKAGPQPTEAEFLVRNPFEEAGSFVFDAELDDPWIDGIVEFSYQGFPIDLPYFVDLEPYESILIHMTVTPPEDAQHGNGGVIIAKQYLDDDPFGDDMPVGDITFPVLVDLYPPEAIIDLNVTEVNGDMMLSWTPATIDVAGNLDHIACYNVYRGETFDFIPGLENRIGRVAVDQDQLMLGFQFFDADPFGDEDYTYLVRVEDEAGYESGNSNLGYHGTGDVSLKVFLEGPYTGSGMTTLLNSNGVMPYGQPYNSDPEAIWYYTGTESVPSIPDISITDWVKVEFRDALSVELATPATTINTQAAFLLSDGSIVGLDGVSPLRLYEIYQHNLYVVIWHRNHLGVLSANPLVPTGVNQYSYDFTTSPAQAYLDGQLDLGGGIYGMYGADGKPDGGINVMDKNVWNSNAGSTGYNQSDYNLDTQIDNKDKNDIWLPNLGKGTKVPN